MTCKKALDAAEEVKKKHGDGLTLQIDTNDSEEARGYGFKSGTNVLLDEEQISLDLAIDADKLDELIAGRMNG